MLRTQEYLEILLLCIFSLSVYKNSYNLTTSVFNLNTYKHVQSLTFVSCLLNNPHKTPKFISVTKEPSVSYCSTVMLHVLFNFLSCILLSALRRILICDQSRYRICVCLLRGGGGGGGFRGQAGITDTQTVYFRIGSRGLSVPHITFCNYRCFNISLFPNTVVFYIFTYYESD